jgi:hypothetical protein
LRNKGVRSLLFTDPVIKHDADGGRRRYTRVTLARQGVSGFRKGKDRELDPLQYNKV